MSAKSGIFRAVVSGLVATGFAAAIYFPDHQTAESRQFALAESWARQLGSQAETLTLKAREMGERDPVGYAVNLMSQGEEPRHFRAQKRIQILENTNSIHNDSKGSFFESTQILFPQESEGVTFQIPIEYRGFLGTPSRLFNDLAIFLVILGMFTTSMGLFSLRDRLKMREKMEQSRDKLEAWALGAKQLLTVLGSHIRDMIRQAQTLAVSSFKSRNHIEALRQHLHEGLGGVHQGVKHIAEVQQLLAHGEKLAADALKRGQTHFETKDFERYVKTLRASVAKTQQTLIQLELNMEPLTIEADQAFHALEGVQTTAKKMNESITQTTQGIMDHHRRVEDLKSDSA